MIFGTVIIYLIYDFLSLTYRIGEANHDKLIAYLSSEVDDTFKRESCKQKFVPNSAEYIEVVLVTGKVAHAHITPA
jgi:hypothetical protein